MKRFEEISEEDRVSDKEKAAFEAMQHDIKQSKNHISEEDPGLHLEIEKIIETLQTDQQKEVVRGRFLRGETLEEVGEHLGVGKQRIREIEAKALSLLRHPERIKFLEGFKLESRNKSTYASMLEDVIIKYGYRTERGERVEKILERIRRLDWYHPSEVSFSKLDSETFNQICDEIKAVLVQNDSEKVTVVALEKIEKKLKQELEKVK